MEFHFSKHSQEQMLIRGISKEQVEEVLAHPDEIVNDINDFDIVIYQSIIEENKQFFLLRVFVNKNKYPNLIVTLYRTTKINKYYEGKIR